MYLFMLGELNLLKDTQKKIATGIITVLAILNLFLPYADFKTNKHTLYYKPYKSGIMIIIIVFIIFGALLYAELINVKRWKNMVVKFGVSLCTFILSVDQFIHYSAGKIGKAELTFLKEIYNNKNIGFHRCIGVYSIVVLSFILLALNILDIIHNRRVNK